MNVPSPEQYVRLREPAFWAWRFSQFPLGLSALTLLFYGNVDGAIVILLALLVGALAIARTAMLKGRHGQMTLRSGLVVLPSSADGPGLVTLADDQLRGVDIDRGKLWIEWDRGGVSYPLNAFEDPAAVHTLLSSRVLRPDPQLVGFGRAARRRWPFVTLTLTALSLLIYVAMRVVGGSWLSWGAHAPLLMTVHEGQIFRALTSQFLHGGVLELSLTVIGLLSVGVGMERLLGAWRSLIIYTIALVGGTVALNPALVALRGGMALPFGALGCWGVLAVWRSAELPGGFRWTWNHWMTIPMLLALMAWKWPTWVLPSVCAGIFCAAVTLVLLGKGRLWTEPSSPVPELAVATTVLLAIGLAAGALHARRAPEQDLTSMARSLLRNPNTIALNDVAWGIATLPNPSHEALVVASEASEEAIRMSAADARLLDTRAMLLYRMGDVASAVELEHIAFGFSDEVYLFNHMAKFLLDRGPMPATGLFAEFAGQSVVVHVQDPLPLGAIAYFLVMGSSGPRGLLRVAFERPTDRFIHLEALADHPAFKDWTDSARLEPMWVDTRGCAGCRDGVPIWRYAHVEIPSFSREDIGSPPPALAFSYGADLSFAIPPEWRAIWSPDNAFYFGGLAPTPLTVPYGSNIVVVRKNREVDVGFDRFAENLLSQAESLPGFREIDRGRISLAGRHGMRRSYSVANPLGGRVWQDQVVVAEGDWVYLLVFTSPGHFFVEDQKIFAEALASLRFPRAIAR